MADASIDWENFCFVLTQKAVCGGNIPCSEAVGSCKDHGSTALQLQVLDSFSSGCNDKAGNVAWVTLLPVYDVG